MIHPSIAQTSGIECLGKPDAGLLDLALDYRTLHQGADYLFALARKEVVSVHKNFSAILSGGETISFQIIEPQYACRYLHKSPI